MEKAGFAKLQRFCALAKDHRFDYAWMDICCIDKTSSAELSEAINSKYRLYQNVGRLLRVLGRRLRRRKSPTFDKVDGSPEVGPCKNCLLRPAFACALPIGKYLEVN
jgi:hypothetical protein